MPLTGTHEAHVTGLLTNIRPLPDGGVAATVIQRLGRLDVHIDEDVYAEHAALITSGGRVTIGGEYAGAGIRVREVTA